LIIKATRYAKSNLLKRIRKIDFRQMLYCSNGAVYVEIGKWTYYFDDSNPDDVVVKKWLTSDETDGSVVHDI
jgi:hypothetical protein|tara:strand:- start:259 stop:474 length:216 start_codon:yes stop_codon:yes gene_type:complete